MGSSYNPPSSGSGTPELPVWTYTAGAMAAGKLKTNHANPASTTIIDLSVTAKNGGSSTIGNLLLSLFAGTANIILTNSTGESAAFEILGTTNNTTYVTMEVGVFNGGTLTAWSGDYSVSFSTYEGVIPDTGWTANGNAGDKTIDVPAFDEPDYSGSDTINQMKVETLSAHVTAMTKKLQAIQTALVSKVLPNA